MNIFGIKLVTGEDIIAKVVSGTNNKTTLANPAMLGMVPDSMGRPTPGLADMLPFADKKQIVLSDFHILYMYTPVQPMLNAYNERFGNGIITAVKPSLLVPETSPVPPRNDNVIPFTKD